MSLAMSQWTSVGLTGLLDAMISSLGEISSQERVS